MFIPFFFPFKRINPKAGSESYYPWKHDFLGLCMHIRRAGLGLGGGVGGTCCPSGLRGPGWPESDDSLLKEIPRGLPDLLP